MAWARTNMPEATYQCIPGMFYGLCLIRESVIYKQDMRDNDIQAHRVQRSQMLSAVVESVNTPIPSILKGPKSSIIKDPKFDFGALKTFVDWKPRRRGSRFGGQSISFWVGARWPGVS
jgi:hypothetical protein